MKNKKRKWKLIALVVFCGFLIFWGLTFHYYIKQEHGNYLIYSVVRNHPLLCKTLLFFGTDANEKDKYGETPLYKAAIYNHPEICKLLIEHGADVNAKNKDGETPLYYAKLKKRHDIINLLKQYGAKE